MRKGISLITLVITIIIMIVIAGAVVISLSNTNIFNRANKAAFVSDIKAILEEYNIYQTFYIADGNDISSLNIDASNIHEVVSSIQNNLTYKDKIAVVNGEITYLVNLKDIEDVERAKWACEVGMKVNGVEGCEDIEYIEPLYKKHGGIYHNAPDLTGFNPETTYYVTYVDGKENSTTNISNKPPENWYDYEHQKWANIVTINNGLKAYFVWIPRYVYKIDEKVNIRFVDNDNVYIDENGTETRYYDPNNPEKYIKPEFDENGKQIDYVLSSAFYIDLETEGITDVKQLPGFWVSKYEVQDEAIQKAEFSIGTNFIELVSISTNAVKFDYYLDDELKAADLKTKYKYVELKNDTKYNIKIVAKDFEGNVVGMYTREMTTLGNATNGITMFPADTYNDKIVVYNTILNDLAKQNNNKRYEFYLDDELKAETQTGTYTFNELVSGRTYKVTVKIKDDGIYYGEYTRTLTTTGNPVYGEANKPELGTLLKAGTYYLTWTDDGQEIKTEVVDTNGNVVPPPSNWYNYANKEWANIVVKNDDIKAEIHLVWIPRYEYKVMGTESSEQKDKKIDISFIPITQLEATEGYILQPAFDINMGTEKKPDIKHLAGFWASKYEVQDVPKITVEE